MIQSRAFVKVPRNEDSHPLDECYTWAKAHCMQVPIDNEDAEEYVTPMLVVVRHEGDTDPSTPTQRRYTATTLHSFVPAYEAIATDAERHYEEVIGLGPCKAYCDLELEYDKKMGQTPYTDRDELRAALDASADALIAEIVACHRERCGIAPRPFVMRAHKPSKWSMHVVFADSVWRSAAHVGAFMHDLVLRRQSTDPLVMLYVDTCVYGRFRCMRLYRSSKLKEPGRSLLADDETSTSPVDTARLLDSLITALPVPALDAADQAFYTTTAFLDRYPEMVAQLGFAPLECASVSSTRLTSTLSAPAATGGDDEAHSPLDAEFKRTFRLHFAHYKPYAFRWHERSALVHVVCNSRQCVIAHAEHHSNRVYIEIDVMQALWRHGCWSERCRRGKTEWRALPSDVAALCRAFAPRWRYAQRFAGLAALVGSKE